MWYIITDTAGYGGDVLWDTDDDLVDVIGHWYADGQDGEETIADMIGALQDEARRHEHLSSTSVRGVRVRPARPEDVEDILDCATKTTTGHGSWTYSWGPTTRIEVERVPDHERTMSDDAWVAYVGSPTIHAAPDPAVHALRCGYGRHGRTRAQAITHLITD